MYCIAVTVYCVRTVYIMYNVNYVKSWRSLTLYNYVKSWRKRNGTNVYLLSIIRMAIASPAPRMLTHTSLSVAAIVREKKKRNNVYPLSVYPLSEWPLLPQHLEC